MESLTTAHYVVIGLVALAAYVHRHKLLGLPAPAAPSPAPTIQARVIESTAAPLAPAQPPSTAQLLSLVHHQTEADALQKAHETAAAAIVEAKALSKANGLPWTVLATNNANNPPPAPAAVAVPNP